MPYYNKEEEKLIKRYQIERPFLTRFLDLNEQKIIKSVNSDLIFFGGYPEAELKRASYRIDDFSISCLKITYNHKYSKLTHRDVLGAILNLGLKKEVIGDILISEEIFVMISSDFAEFVKKELTKIKNAVVSVKEVDLEKAKYVDNYKEVKLFVKSFRLDLMISQVFKLSRFDSKEVFVKNLVKVDHRQITNPSFVLDESMLVSVRGFGRFKISSVGNKSKSDNIFVIVKLYK